MKDVIWHGLKDIGIAMAFVGYTAYTTEVRWRLEREIDALKEIQKLQDEETKKQLELKSKRRWW